MDSFAGLSMSERKLIVGIDFGTTFSGIAWAETRRSDHQNVVETWPSNIETVEGVSSEKVPTELRYTPNGMEWGFQIPSGVPRFQWFKLGLEEGKVKHTEDGQRKSCDELTVDYLTALTKHLMYTLEQKIGKTILRTIELEFCLTVPAIWSEVAKEKTLRACERAGLRSRVSIHLVSEPEAAAMCALHGLDPHGLEVGDSFVLCDAGGGTVDLISYTVTDLSPTLKVKEAAEGTGGLCGSTFLNRRFEAFLTTRLGAEPGWDSDILAEAMEKFDSVIKKQYSPQTSNQDGYLILVPGLKDNENLNIRRGRLTITPTEMSGIFEPIVEKITKLVQGQISATNKRIKAVILVGGFGQNNYLKERIRSSVDQSITVLQPPNAWSAVVRGAVMMGLSRTNAGLAAVRIGSRVARKHYGTLLTMNFIEGMHDKSERSWDSAHQCYVVSAMDWIIKKGSPVDQDKPTTIGYDDEFLVSQGQPKSTSTTIFCDDTSPTAPAHKTSNVRKLVKLEADLSQIPQETLQKTIVTREDGKKYYRLKCEIEATFTSASTQYVLLCQGKRYHTVNAEYV